MHGARSCKDINHTDQGAVVVVVVVSFFFFFSFFLHGNTISIGNLDLFDLKRDEKVYLTPHYSRRLSAPAAGRCHLGSYQ